MFKLTFKGKRYGRSLKEQMKDKERTKIRAKGIISFVW